MHLVFVSLHQYSYWNCCIRDPGYVKTHFKTFNNGEIEVPIPEPKPTTNTSTTTGSENALEGPLEPKTQTKTQWIIYHKDEYEKNRAIEDKQKNRPDLEEGLLEKAPSIRKYTICIDHKNQGSFMGFRYCKKCKDLKLPRTHHCSICNECVMRMDHHCPWTGNCVGMKTHKYFICFCFWTIVACLHVYFSTPFVNPLVTFDVSKTDYTFV